MGVRFVTVGACPCLLAVILAAGSANSAPATAPVYVLDGYRIEGLGPKITAELVAGLEHHPGAHVREADIKADVDLLAKELHARHITGRLFTGTAESNGHLTVYFEVVKLGPPGTELWASHRLVSQKFEGAAGVSASALASASGLKTGDVLSPEKIAAARRAILLLVEKLKPDKALTVKVRIQTKPHGEAALTWIFGESGSTP